LDSDRVIAIRVEPSSAAIRFEFVIATSIACGARQPGFSHFEFGSGIVHRAQRFRERFPRTGKTHFNGVPESLK
jgi:hypothetical protein